MARYKEIKQAARVHCVSNGHDQFAFITGAVWADLTMIDKAVKYLSGLTKCTVSCIGEDVHVPILSEEQLEDFREAMEE